MREEAYAGMAWRACVHLFPPRSGKHAEALLKHFMISPLKKKRRHHQRYCVLDAMASCLDMLAVKGTEGRWRYNAFMRYSAMKMMMEHAEAEEETTRESMELIFKGCFQPTMLKAVSHFQARTSAAGVPRYIFQYATIKDTTTTSKLRRRFIVFRDAWETMFFFSAWHRLQRLDATMLLECGTCDDATPRKWIMDVDAPLLELRKEVAADEEEGLLVEFALEVSRELHAGIGFLRRPCHVAITRRHSETKRSWHITLCAFAPFPQWRAAILRLAAKEPASKKLLRFVDESTVRNSKSQYMQVLGSAKIPSSNNAFQKVGIFPASSTAGNNDNDLFFAASSMMLPDPWSIPYDAHGFTSITTADTNKKKKAKLEMLQPTIAAEEKPKKKRKAAKEDEEHGMTNLHHAWPEEWMRRFAEAKDGTTRLASIPSMREPKNWCPAAMDLVKSSGYEVLMYACVNSMSMCCRILVGEGRVHRHHNDSNAMVFVVGKQSTTQKRRMFVRCFSSKCKAVAKSDVWVEITKEHATSSKAVAAMLLQPLPLLQIISLRPLLDGEQNIRLKKSRQQIIAALLPLEAFSEDIPPPASVQGKVVLCGRKRRACPRGHQPQEQEEAYCCVLEQLEPSTGAYSYRTLVHCMCALCSTFVDPWVEIHC